MEMLANPLCITQRRKNGWYINGHFINLLHSLSRNPRVPRAYRRCSAALGAVPRAAANFCALIMALEMPSKLLGLMSPAASPIRNTPFPPRQKSFHPAGRNTRQASVLSGAPKRKPRCSSAFF